MGQEAPGTVAIVQSLVELLKETATMMMIALVISYVEVETASLHFQDMMTAAMTPFQVSKDFTVIAQIAFMGSS